MKNKVRVGLIIIGVVITINISLVFSMGRRQEKDKAKNVVQKEEKVLEEKKQDSAIVPAGEKGKVQYEEYVPEVLIKGKWGKGPGEFGIQADEEKRYHPSSIVVDNEGNIYILDVVNNRIKKYNKNGKSILNIPVDSFKGNINSWFVRRFDGDWGGDWVEQMEEPKGIDSKNVRPYIRHVKVLGINMVIDSKDNLYYYCIRGEKGEVWLFKDDKLVRKWEVAYRNYMDKGIIIDTLDDSIWSRSIIQNKKIQINKNYNVKEGKVYAKEERKKQREKIKREYLKKGVKKEGVIRTGRSHSEPVSLKVTDEGIQVYKIKVIKKGNK